VLVQGSSPDEYAREEFIEDELFMTIESLRCELLEVAQQRSLTDSAVVALSERLDKYILLAQQKMMARLRSRETGASFNTI